MKQIYRFVTAVFISSFVFISCKKEKVANTIEGDLALTDEQEAFLASAKDTLIQIDDIVLENGQSVRSFLEENDPEFLNGYGSKNLFERKDYSPKYQKMLFISRVLQIGGYLVNRDKHDHAKGPGNDEPAQHGLAYSTGSKDYNIRQFPPFGDCRDLKIYGLDCSGMIWCETTGARLPPVVPRESFKISEISDVNRWTAAFKSSADYKDLKMENKGQLEPNDMKTGDIILWDEHGGIYLHGSFYQSNGTRHAPGCSNNTAQDKGPRLISLNDVLNWGLGNYKVFRINTGNSYTLTAQVNLQGFSYSSLCKLGSYPEKAVISITLTEGKPDAVLNYIVNTDPEVTFEPAADCKCPSFTFDNKSAIDVTDFRASILKSNYLRFNLTYTFSGDRETIQCGDAPAIAIISPGSTGIQIEDSIPLPRAGENPNIIPFYMYNQGTLTIAMDN